jgi:hypothetical protein
MRVLADATIPVYRGRRTGYDAGRLRGPGFDPRLYNELDFQRGRVKPRTFWIFSVGAS